MDSYFLGAVSKDENGEFLFNTLKEYGVKLDYVSRVDNKTAYSKVELVNCDRKFSFSRDNTADLNYSIDFLPKDLTDNDIIHFCSVSLIDSITKETHIKLLEDCLKKNVVVSYDVNLRPSLWKDKQAMINTSKEFIKYANVCKFSEEEIEMMFRTINPSIVFEEYPNLDIVIITMGEKGSSLYTKEFGFVNNKVAKKVVDTTGAGDCFIGSFLYKYQKADFAKDFNTLYESVDFASHACMIEVCKMGAMESLPTLVEVRNSLFK